jgi:5'-nucleotidase
VLAAYLHEASKGAEDHTLIVDAGDMVGASSLASSLLHDEPTIMFLNQLANEHCKDTARDDPRCNIVGTLGNHEFDKGVPELLRVQTGKGGNAADGPFLQAEWRGASFPIVSANVVWKDSGQPILPPYVIKHVPYTDPKTGAQGEVPIAFIGATVKGTPFLTSPSAVASVRFLDEAEAVNHYLPEIRAKGVHAVVLLIHEGGMQTPYEGVTDATRPNVNGAIVDIVKRLDDGVAIVCSGHTHAFTNALLPNANGKQVLVTQAFSYSTAFAQIDLSIDPQTDTVVSKEARVIGTFGDAAAGITPDPQVAALVARAEARVSSIADQPIVRIAQDFTRETAPNGESVIGDLITDSHREAAGADFAFMNAGGLRDDLRKNPATGGQPEGMVRFKDVYSTQPFSNNVVKLTLTGQQIYDLLNQQFPTDAKVEQLRPSLSVSGLSYTWDRHRGAQKIVEVRKDGKSIALDQRYTVAANAFLADGGDRYSVLKAGQDRTVVMGDLDATIQYLKKHADANTGLFAAPVLGLRISTVN